MKKSQLSFLLVAVVLTLSAASNFVMQANAITDPTESTLSSSSVASFDSSSCGADSCKVTTQAPGNDGKCPAGYTEYTYSLDGGNQKQMCAKCEGLDKCPSGETCTLEKYTQEVGGHTIKHMRCLCKKTETSSSESSVSTESSVSSDFSSSSL